METLKRKMDGNYNLNLVFTKKYVIVMGSYIAAILCFFITCDVFGQITESNIEITVKNDDAGEISNWLNTGDDLGETQTTLIAFNLLKKDNIYNFRIKIESTEYSALNDITPEPRDILFTEQNNIQLAMDNNKFNNNSYFFSCAAGLFYIQSNRITIGATGQKYYWHKWIVNKFFSNKYWIYVDSHIKDRYIPHADFKYGYNKLLFKRAHASLNTINKLECRIASNFNYTGIGASSYFDLKLSNDRLKMQSLDIEMEGNYLTNIAQYQTSYLQIGTRLNFKNLAICMQVNKPITKYLENPFILYDDMELLFNYGLVFFIK